MPTRRSLHRTMNALRNAALASVAFVLLLACGDADHVRVPPADDAGSEAVQVNSGVNVCPRFSGSLVMPQRIGPNESSSIAVRATEPDAPDSLLIFAWSAASGTFTPADKAATKYRCGEIGTESLTVTATDQRGCVSTLQIDVECVAN